MMNNTYSMIISQSERAWSFQWARTLFALERSVPESELAAYQREYSINMAAKIPEANTTTNQENLTADSSEAGGSEVGGGGSAKEQFVPALMIIKRMGFTRAERRRLVLGYWKVS